MQILRCCVVIAVLLTLLLTILVVILPTKPVVHSIPLGMGQELNLNLWPPTPNMLITLWYQAPGVHRRIVGVTVPAIPVALLFSLISLGMIWLPHQRPACPRQ
jgi:hypothetical protein